MLKDVRDQDKISQKLYEELKPIGSQPSRLYGLAKVHKEEVPMRPVLSMPGSPYHKIALKMTQWLSVVSECKINCSTQEVSESLHTVMLHDEDELISFDVQSLYTNVPVYEAINVCTDLLFSGKYGIPPVDLDTFKQLLEISSHNVLMLTCDEYYRQVDGLAMGSPPAPLLANGWLSKFDNAIGGEAKLYFRYMDDILSTDTGLTMNFHALAPRKCKKSVVSGFFYRIYRACSTWKCFHQGLEHVLLSCCIFYLEKIWRKMDF